MKGDVVVRADPGRLWRDINELGSIGARPGQGVTRLALTDEDLEGRQWLKERMEATSLQVTVDPAANVIGRLESGAEKTVIIGSHLDTVPSGGMFDGALGILTGLECARVLQESGVRLPWNLEIIAFTDEEGYHNAGTFGSRAMMGLATREEMKTTKTPGVPTLEESFTRLGMSPDTVLSARRDPAGIRAYFELHVEQGITLVKEGIQLGAVTGIVGLYRYVVGIVGETNHAGTTPMDLRRDALVLAAPLFTLLPRWVMEEGKDTVGTIGQIRLEPGAMNVVPGLCEFTVELRSLRKEAIERLAQKVRDYAVSLPPSRFSEVGGKDPVWLDEELVDLITRAADMEGYSIIRMPSGAGHDAISFAPYVPTAMIFVPSQGGKSHTPQEWTEPEDAARGAQALLRTLLELARSDREKGS